MDRLVSGKLEKVSLVGHDCSILTLNDAEDGSEHDDFKTCKCASIISAKHGPDVRIISNQLTESMTRRALDCGRRALTASGYNGDLRKKKLAIASFVTAECNGPSSSAWQCIVGASELGGHVNALKGSVILFALAAADSEVRFLLFKGLSPVESAAATELEKTERDAEKRENKKRKIISLIQKVLVLVCVAGIAFGAFVLFGEVGPLVVLGAAFAIQNIVVPLFPLKVLLPSKNEFGRV